MQRWYGLNNEKEWKQYIKILYSMVNYWQGAWLSDLVIFNTMSSTIFTSSAAINTALLPLNPIGNQVLLDAIFTDPWYGLENYENYYRW